MLRKIVLLALIVCFLSCDKDQKDGVGCPTDQTCTMEFAMLGVNFKDKDGNPVVLKNITVINQRTNESVMPTIQSGINTAGYYIITDDGARKKFSTDGDEVIVTATHPNGQVKTATYKVSGGCNCHIKRISGPLLVTFD